MTTKPAILSPLTFTEGTTRAVLADVCRAVGIDPAGARLLRHQSNAVYLLAGAPVVVKIARPDRGADRAGRALTVARWLAERGVPAVSPFEVPQPVRAAGCVATFWTYLPQPEGRSITAVHIGPLLRALHALPDRPPVPVPALDAPAAVIAAIRASRILCPPDRTLLLARLADIQARLADHGPLGPTTLLHGDAQHRNTLFHGAHPVLADLESVVLGPAAWDLVTVEVHCRRFGHRRSEYAAFSRAYGADVTTHPAYAALRDLRELKMISTNAGKAAPGSAPAAEVHRRVAQLRRGDHTARWQIL